VLSYFGQAGLAMVDPSAIAGGNPFFSMVPEGWPALALVILATAATVIASQALISGVFSLTAQAMEMGYMPRLQVMHTSREERGQVYVPVINWLLAFACILLVLVFRQSSNLAAAYGLAVVGTMVITTLMIGRVAVKCWGWAPWQGHALSAAFLIIEIPFLVACLTKLPEGGYFPLLVAGLLMAVMMTWRRGRALVFHQILSNGKTVADLAAEMRSPTTPFLPGQLVFVTTRRDTRHAVSRAFELMRRGGALREKVVIMSLISAMESDVDMPESVRVEPCGEGLWHVMARHGFMQLPHAPDVLARASELSDGGIAPPGNQTFYVLPRELIVEHIGNQMPHWQRALFGFLGRNVSYAPDYLFIPHRQILEFTWMLKA
jgi:KUP system potassium uptake protein